MTFFNFLVAAVLIVTPSFGASLDLANDDVSEIVCLRVFVCYFFSTHHKHKQREHPRGQRPIIRGALRAGVSSLNSEQDSDKNKEVVVDEKEHRSLVLIPENDECSAAIQVSPSNTILTTGDTTYAVPAMSRCENRESQSPALWYRVMGTGQAMTVDTCATTSGMKTLIFVYEHNGNACGNSSAVCFNSLDFFNVDKCGGNGGSFVAWKSQANVEYFILVGGDENPPFSGIPDKGTFLLRVTSAPAPINDECSTAIQVSPSDTGLITADTTYALLDGYVSTCYGSGFHPQSPALWYRVTGTGAMMTADTCASTTSAMWSVVSVYRQENGCGSSGICLDKNDGNSTMCGTGTRSFVSWLSEQNVEYHVRVAGYVEYRGTFSLRITSAPSPVQPTPSPVAPTAAPIPPTPSPVAPTAAPIPLSPSQQLLANEQKKLQEERSKLETLPQEKKAMQQAVIAYQEEVVIEIQQLILVESKLAEAQTKLLSVVGTAALKKQQKAVAAARVAVLSQATVIPLRQSVVALAKNLAMDPLNKLLAKNLNRSVTAANKADAKAEKDIAKAAQAAAF